jgi:hypothetical protein
VFLLLGTILVAVFLALYIRQLTAWAGRKRNRQFMKKYVPAFGKFLQESVP